MLSWEFKLAWGENCSKNRKIRAKVYWKMYGRPINVKLRGGGGGGEAGQRRGIWTPIIFSVQMPDLREFNHGQKSANSPFQGY